MMPSLAGAQDARDIQTISASLKLRTGGQISGAVLDYDGHGLVVLSGETPYVFAWSELEPATALNTQRNLKLWKAGEAGLYARDHFDLGMFALRAGRNDLASNEFDLAKRKDPTLAANIKKAFDEFRAAAQRRRDSRDQPAELLPTAPASPESFTGFEPLSPKPTQTRDEVRKAYLQFGEIVRERLGRDIRLVESDHFLIWTDFGPREQTQLVQWFESMYQTLCARFKLDASQDIFLAKCPVFCFRSRARLKSFARDFDGYDARNAIGYTRSIEANGHVHMAFARMGSDPADLDRFACTLVHEGTHAFLHRLYSTRLLPHWLNEGYAELTAERVLGDRCPAGENANLLARQYARFHWPLGSFLTRVSTIEIHEYPLACAVVRFLEEQGADRLVGTIRDLKSGRELREALAANYDGMTLEQLERQFKEEVRHSGHGEISD